jgi:hypothetical protein
VLTLPDDLNPLALVNQRVIYRILFRAGSETLLELGRDPKHLGGEIGVLATLHTWGQNMLDHPSRRGSDFFRGIYLTPVQSFEAEIDFEIV